MDLDISEGSWDEFPLDNRYSLFESESNHKGNCQSKGNFILSLPEERADS
jgi:hypothetical protein